ncbi:hypothetical protein REPUB_Repub06bG0191300 [Reevesia pubescens]
MLKLMKVCKARGFVYGSIPEKGKPVSGASDNVRAWWKENVNFDKNGPTTIAKYEEYLAMNESNNSRNGNPQSSLQDLQDATLYFRDNVMSCTPIAENPTLLEYVVSISSNS